MPAYPWSSANVFSYKDKLWWVDLRHGILSFNPLAADPQVLFVTFPEDAADTKKMTPLMRRDISKHRCVNLSDGKLWFVEMTRCAYGPRVTMWTLVDPKKSTWEQKHDVNLRDIWADESYQKASLPKKRPVLAGVHPFDPAVIYFLNKGKLFGVNLGTMKVHKSVVLFEPASAGPEIDEESSRFLLTWDLPPAVTSSSGDTNIMFFQSARHYFLLIELCCPGIYILLCCLLLSLILFVRCCEVNCSFHCSYGTHPIILLRLHEKPR